MSYTHWVAGFLFRNEGTEVALVLKTHPAWQKGKLNGVGGKIDEGEEPAAAMRREFLEEAGADVKDWKEFLLLKVQDGQVHFFVAHGEHEIKSQTDEKVRWYKVSEINSLPVIHNLRWQIPLALDRGVKNAAVEYFQDKQN
jgi:8-oxo-dGTP diphosphatase